MNDTTRLRGLFTMSEHKGVTQHPRQRCYFCGSDGPIQTHHVVPRRYDGSDDEENLVDLCCNCHQRLEKLYDKRFYQEISVAQTANAQVDYDVELAKENAYRTCNPTASKDILIENIGISCGSENVDYQAAKLIVDDMIEKGWLAESKKGITTAYEWEHEVDIVSPNETSQTQRDKIKNVKGLISNLEEQERGGAPLSKLVDKAEEKLNLTTSELEDELQKLRDKGEIYEPYEDGDVIRTT